MKKTIRAIVKFETTHGHTKRKTRHCYALKCSYGRNSWDSQGNRIGIVYAFYTKEARSRWILSNERDREPLSSRDRYVKQAIRDQLVEYFVEEN